MSGVASEKKSVSNGVSFFLDGFARRQWEDASYGGTKISFPQDEFVRRVEQYHAEGSAPLVDGYADFCKHVFVPNFISATADALSIVESNRQLLQSAYKARTPKELPVLVRWFPADRITLPEAKFLDVILYSREQLVSEYRAMQGGEGKEREGRKESGAEDPETRLPDSPWGIICVKAQDVDHELPMQPITMMRNALGKQEGGSGVPLNRDQYHKSVEYWEHHAEILG